MKKKYAHPAVVLGMTATGLSVSRSLGRKGIEVFGFESNTREPGMFSRYVKPKVVPNAIENEQEFIDYLVGFGKRLSRKAALFCAADEYVAAVSKNRERLKPYFKFNIPSKETVENFLDKTRSYAIAKQYGLLCPSTYFVENVQELEKIGSQIKFPCAIKPAISHLWRVKYGGKKLIQVNSYDELLTCFAEIKKTYSQIMIQELIPGKDDQIYLFYAYFDSKSVPIAFSVLRKLRQHPIHFGIGSFNISERNEEVKNIGLEFLKKIKYQGIAGLELKRDSRDGKIKFLELNMRFIMIGELAIASGVDLPYIMYRDLIGEKLEKTLGFKEGIKLVNMELDLGSFWQYRRRNEINAQEYLRSFKGGKLTHTYFAKDDMIPLLFVFFRFIKVVLKKIFRLLTKCRLNISLINVRYLTKVYKSFPHPVKNVTKWGYSFVPLKMRNGKRFYKQLKFLEESQWWSRQELENYQNEELRKLIRHAYDNVPYYNNLFKKHKLSPSDINKINDLSKIPILYKDTVQAAPDLFIARNYKKNHLKHITTSGTTGKVLEIYSDPYNEFINGGPFEWRHFRWGGYDFNDYCAVFRGQFLKFKSFGEEKIFEFNPVQRKVFFSIFDINDEHMAQYIMAGKKFPIKILHGYPVPIRKFVDLLIKSNITRLFSPKAIFTIAEMLLPADRKAIEDYFQCEIFDWYGMEERTITACECEKHQGHHINYEFGIAELIQNDVNYEGDEIIATGLTNYAMPLIRYKTGDYAKYINHKCECGRGLPLIQLFGGRNRNFIVNFHGDEIYAIGMLEKFSDFISQYQYVQKENGVVELKVVGKNIYNERHETILLSDFKKCFGEDFDVKVVLVKRIHENKGGKTPLVVFKA